MAKFVVHAESPGMAVRPADNMARERIRCKQYSHKSERLIYAGYVFIRRFASPHDAAGIWRTGCSGQQENLVRTGYCSYINPMRVTFDPSKRDKTLHERGLDFADAAIVFDGQTLEVEDTRKDYGETRIICYGLLAGRMVVVGYTPRGAVRHIFSMRKANDREKDRIGPHLGL